MSWLPYRQKRTKLQWFPKKASTALSAGALVDVIDGFIEVCAIARRSHSGIMQKTVVSTDSDYASATRCPIMVPQSANDQWKVTVLSSDTAVATDVGNFYDIGGSPVGIDVTRASSDDDAFLVDQFLSANLVVGRLNAYKAMKEGLGTEV